MGDFDTHDAPQGYSFSVILQNYLEEKLKVEKLKIKTAQAGNQLSQIDKRAIKANDKKKVKILNNHIFRSMANLIYFFEFVADHEQLKRIFDNDVEELLGFKGLYVRGREKDEKFLVFERLIGAMIGYTNKNTRLQLIKAISRWATKSLLDLAKEIDPELGTKIIHHDLDRTEFWAKYCTSEIKQNTNNPHRKLGF